VSVLARAEISDHGGSAVVKMKPMLQGVPAGCVSFSATREHFHVPTTCLKLFHSWMQAVLYPACSHMVGDNFETSIYSP
jgi:hypothetical protein